MVDIHKPVYIKDMYFNTYINTAYITSIEKISESKVIDKAYYKVYTVNDKCYDVAEDVIERYFGQETINYE